MNVTKANDAKIMQKLNCCGKSLQILLLYTINETIIGTSKMKNNLYCYSFLLLSHRSSNILIEIVVALKGDSKK